jgi:RNA-directed DNA polymerase
MRIISQPARELKLLQRSLLDLRLKYLPIHPAATAYRKGVSLRQNAEPHIGCDTIIKMDFKNFFPSIRGQDWIAYCRANNVFETEFDIKASTLLLFHRPKSSSVLRLSIGAPTSPLVSNVLLFNFDNSITERLPSSKINYTRYADDLTFSAPRAGYLHGVTSIVARTLREMPHPRLEINGEKTHTVTRKYHQIVTGLTLADQAVSIGRDKKRLIRAAVHHFTLGKLNSVEIRSLCGQLAYINSVEPAFINILRERYGDDAITSLQRWVWRGPARKLLDNT